MDLSQYPLLLPVGFGQRPGQMGISGDSICLLFFLQGPDTDNDMIQFSISQKKRTGQRPTWRTENVFCRKLFWFLFKFEIWTENRQVDWQCSTNGTLQTPNGKDQSFRLLRGKNKCLKQIIHWLSILPDFHNAGYIHEPQDSAQLFSFLQRCKNETNKKIKQKLIISSKP